MWVKIIRKLLFLFLLGFSLTACGGNSSNSTSNELKTGTISGKITGKNGLVTGAYVQLSSIDGEDCAAANDKSITNIEDVQTQADIDRLKNCRRQFGDRIQTDEKGSYKFENVPAGKYTIWIHWDQRDIPSIKLATVPSTGFFFTTLAAVKVGNARLDVGMHEETLGLYEIDVNIPTFTFTAEEPLKVNFKW